MAAAVAAATSTNLAISGVIGRAFGAMREHWAIFAAYMLALWCLPFWLMSLALASGPGDFSTVEGRLAALRYGSAWDPLLYMVFQPILTAIVARTIWADFSGVPARTLATVSAVLRRLASVLLTNLVVWICVCVGAAFLVIPGVILSLLFWLSVPACVVEGLDTPGALRRSVELTRRQRWRLLAGALIAAVVVMAIYSVFYGLRRAFGFDLFQMHGPVAWLVRSLEGGLPVLLWAVVTGSAYVELRRLKEGPGAEATAAVFA